MRRAENLVAVLLLLLVDACARPTGGGVRVGIDAVPFPKAGLWAVKTTISGLPALDNTYCDSGGQPIFKLNEGGWECREATFTRTSASIVVDMTCYSEGIAPRREHLVASGDFSSNYAIDGTSRSTVLGGVFSTRSPIHRTFLYLGACPSGDAR
jgi:hypothetical protein